MRRQSITMKIPWDSVSLRCPFGLWTSKVNTLLMIWIVPTSRKLQLLEAAKINYLNRHNWHNKWTTLKKRNTMITNVFFTYSIILSTRCALLCLQIWTLRTGRRSLFTDLSPTVKLSPSQGSCPYGKVVATGLGITWISWNISSISSGFGRTCLHHSLTWKISNIVAPNEKCWEMVGWGTGPRPSPNNHQVRRASEWLRMSSGSVHGRYPCTCENYPMLHRVTGFHKSMQYEIYII